MLWKYVVFSTICKVVNCCRAEYCRVLKYFKVQQYLREHLNFSSSAAEHTTVCCTLPYSTSTLQSSMNSRLVQPKLSVAIYN